MYCLLPRHLNVIVETVKNSVLTEMFILFNVIVISYEKNNYRNKIRSEITYTRCYN